MIAFDLDGVLVPDLLLENNFLSQELNELRTSIIIPIMTLKNLRCDWYLITGRPVDDKELTLGWLLAHNLTPSKVFHENTDFKKAKEYKMNVLNDNPLIQIYVESCYQQSEFLRKNCKTNIVHFSSFIEDKLNEMLSPL